ncbi:phage gp6-like head-tail connector protein [Diaphorobacter sp. DS2]|nr:phage gp6-like head-tail connector protein [Alicycliphilus denitrificans]TFI46659.1 phage gp6-like head-tail connector protein [Diaphorobacter sp. DS2]GAO23289.1 phage protein [Alicycliphilus sp. B1]
MLTLNETKLHLRVDHDDEDALILAMIDTAASAVANDLNMEVIDLDTDAPAPVKSAALLLVGDLYANREAQTERPLTSNQTYARLLAPYRVYA